MSKKLAVLACAVLVAAAALGQNTYTFKRFAGAANQYSNEDGIGATVTLWPSRIAADRHGNVYFPSWQGTVRKIAPSGLSTTLAGLNNASGIIDGRGENARFNQLNSVVSDADGNVYVVDLDGDYKIRRITPYGLVTTLVSGLACCPMVAAADTDGTVYFLDGASTLQKLNADGTISVPFPGKPGVSVRAVARALSGAFYFATGQAVYKLDTAGRLTLLTQHLADAIAVDSGETVYTSTTDWEWCCAIQKIDANGNASDWAGESRQPGTVDGVGTAARFTSIYALTADESGNVYAADESLIRKVTSNGVVSTLVGVAPAGALDATGTDARFRYPMGVARDSGGVVYVSDTKNHTIRRISPSGAVTTLAGRAGIAGFIDGAVADARFDEPVGITVDAAGVIFVADSKNNAVRKISGGTVSTVGTFQDPRGVAIDLSSGNLYVSELTNNRIMRVTPTGAITTFAGQYMAGGADGEGTSAQFNHPNGLAVAPNGDVFVADTYGATIRRVTASGLVTTVAGTYVGNTDQGGSCGHVDGPSATAVFCAPQGVAVDGAGHVYVTDSNPILLTSSIRRVAQGTVTTLGGWQAMGSGSDGTGSGASFCQPSGITSDAQGNLWIADSFYNDIRMGRPTIADAAIVDVATGAINATRQLDTSPQTATSWAWRMVRRPAGSVANVSSSTSRNPTFTPDVAGLFTFELTALADNGMSITKVDVTAAAMSSTTTLTASSATSHYGQPVTFTATVTNAAAGEVVFTDSTVIVARVTVVGGAAVWTTTSLAPGSHSIAARFEGDYVADPSAALALGHSVDVLTTVALTSSHNPAALGQGVRFTATLNSACTGTVQFRDGAADLGGPILISGGVATYTTTALAPGTHSVTAAFGGSTLCSSAVSDPLSQVVKTTPLPKPFDFNGDGTSDAILRNRVTNEIALWEFAGGWLAGGAIVATDNGNVNYGHAGDCEGDGKSELLAQFDGGGLVELRVDGLAITSSSWIDNSLPFANWRLILTTDLDDDGISELVGQSTVDGRIGIGKIIADVFVSTTVLTSAGQPYVPGAQWKVVAAGDFDGDGNAELVLQNGSTGDVHRLKLEASVIIADDLVGNPGPTWTVKGAGDFTGDGRADIVLQQAETNYVAVWQMNGPTLVAGWVIGTPPAAWEVVGVGDYDSGGVSEILLQDSNTGNVARWYTNGVTVTAGHIIDTPGVDWVILH